MPAENFIAGGDQNCRLDNWGYSDSNLNGKNLADLATTKKLLKLYAPKQPASFISGRWKRETNPDLTFSTQIYETVPERYVLKKFSRSQHRPFLITTPPLISFTNLAPIPRRNFRKADWELFTEELEKEAEALPTPCKENHNIACRVFTRLMKAVAKKCILRGFGKSYIPTLDENCQGFYNLYKEAVFPEEISISATNLVNKLNEMRQARWKEPVSDVDFTHSSRKAWHNINKLTGRNSTKANILFRQHHSKAGSSK